MTQQFDSSVYNQNSKYLATQKPVSRLDFDISQSRNSSSVQDQNVHIHTIYYHLSIKRNEVLIYVITWINCENMLSERSQAEKATCYDSIYLKYLEQQNQHRKKVHIKDVEG